MADTTLQMLLKRLAIERAAPLPEPAAPMSLGPLSTETTAAYGALNPEPVPPMFAQPAPVDAGFVSQYAGAAPAPPAPLSQLQRIMNMLGGIGAGIQGQGAQYLERLDEPRRRYERELERYQGRRAQGVELAERRAEREADRANRASELSYEREFNVWLKKTGVRDAEAKERMRQAFDIQKLREAERIADERQAVRDKAQQERDARLIARDYGKLTDNPKIALELGRYYAGLTDKLSPEAAKFESVQNKLAEARTLRLARVAAGGGGTGGGGASSGALKVAQEIQTVKDKMIEAEAKGDKRAMEQLILRAKAAFRRAARFPEIEAGFDASGKWPYVKMRTPQGSVPLPGYGAPQAVAPQGQQSDPLGIR